MPERLLVNGGTGRGWGGSPPSARVLPLLLVVPCLLLGGPAAAQPAAMEGAIRAAVAGDADRESLRQAAAVMAESGYPAEAAPRLLQLARELAQAGIGVDDLASKVKEGVAKKVAPDRVMAVLSERAERLKDGRALVLDLSGEGTVFLDQQMAFRVIADYMARGISREELRKRILSRSLADFPALENVIR